MSLTYVIPDIHGRYDLLSEGLADISRAFRRRCRHHRHDRRLRRQRTGTADRSSNGCCQAWPKAGAWLTLKGNHDAMMVDALRDPSKMASWIAKGGDAALASYGGDPAAVPQSHIDMARRTAADARRRTIASMFTPASIPRFRWTSRAKRRCCGSAIRRDFLAASADFTSFTAMIILPTARCCTKAAPISIRWPGGPDG